MRIKKLSILAACMFIFANMSVATNLPLKKTLSKGQEVRVPVIKGKHIGVEATNEFDGQSKWVGVPFKKGKPKGDLEGRTYTLGEKGKSRSVKFTRNIRAADELVIKVKEGKVSFKIEEITPPPPDMKLKKYDVKGAGGRGIATDPSKELVLKLSGESKDVKAKGKFFVYNGDKPYTGKFKEIDYVLEMGETKSWKFSAENKVINIDFFSTSGKTKIVTEQPKFSIPTVKVKETTEDMLYELNSAIVVGAFGVAKQMLVMGMDINGQDKGGNTPLFMACMNGDPEFVKFLLDQGADPNIKNKQESTAIIAAANESDFFEELVPLLIEKGADVRVKAKDGTTVLWPLITTLGRADEQEILDTVKLVLEKGAEVDSTIEGGRTPLMFAAMMGNQSMVKLLVENGANVNAKSKEGEAPLNLAEKEGHQEVVKFLKASGAK